jgi:two-component system sensor histidine kinase VanS
LKNRKGQKPNYKILEQKVYARIGLIAAASFVVIMILRELARGRLANWIVAFLQNVWHMDSPAAEQLYQQAIRNNINYVMFAAITVCFFILARYLISQFSRYFNEIDGGLDTLVEEKGGDIKLSHEMAAMENKLKSIQHTLEKREQETKSAEQRKNDMLMYLAHDIKTPLTSVIGYLSLLDEAPDLAPEQKAKYVNITLKKAYRLEKLVDEFFEITRYNFQTVVLAEESIDLCYMLAQMTDEFYPLLAANGKQATLQVPEDMSIYGDPDKLARVFNNILKNAIAYSPDNSDIEVSAALKENVVSVVFKNAGTIPKDKLASIFDKFIRLDCARSSDMGGAGLGLAIAKEIVVLHGGRIYADSDGKQTAFTVELPALPEQAYSNCKK